MKLSKKSGAKIAMTAAALVVSGTLATSAMAAGGTEGKCFGVNECKGHGDCKTAQNDCKNMNACKGQGFLSMTDTECAEKGGDFKES
jgi:uncharacterized membrane protein